MSPPFTVAPGLQPPRPSLDTDLTTCDEPCSGLDVASTLILRTLVATLAARGKTIIYSSHVLDMAEKICEEVLILHHGQVVAHNSVARLREMASAGSLEEVFAAVAVDQDVTRIGHELAGVGGVVKPTPKVSGYRGGCRVLGYLRAMRQRRPGIHRPPNSQLDDEWGHTSEWELQMMSFDDAWREWRQFRILSRGRVRAMLDAALLSRDADPVQFALWVGALVTAVPFVFAVQQTFVYSLLRLSPPETVELVVFGDRLFFVVSGMIAAALVTALTWEALWFVCVKSDRFYFLADGDPHR